MNTQGSCQALAHPQVQREPCYFRRPQVLGHPDAHAARLCTCPGKPCRCEMCWASRAGTGSTPLLP